MRTNGWKKGEHGVPPPAAAVDPETLPRVLSFALCARDRAAVLRVLRRYGPDRSAALRAALGIEAFGLERGQPNAR